MDVKKKANRANFSVSVKFELALAANFRCVRPGCARLTHAYHPDSKRFFNLAAASHDAAAADNGPRPEPDLSREQRSAYGNGAWLCRVCAKLVDDLQDVFPFGTLSAWQDKATERIMKQAASPMPASGISWQTSIVNTKRFCDRVREIRFEVWRPLDGFSFQAEYKADQLVSDCVNIHTGDHQLGSLYAHTVNTQCRITSALRLMINHLRTQDGWFKNYDYQRWQRNCSLFSTPAPPSKIHVGTDRIEALWGEVQSALQHLTDFYMSTQFDHTVLDQW